MANFLSKLLSIGADKELKEYQKITRARPRCSASATPPARHSTTFFPRRSPR